MTKYNNEVRNFFKEDYPKLSLIVTGCMPNTKALTQRVFIDCSSDSRFIYYQNIFNFANTAINQLENTPRHPYKTIIIERFIKHSRMIDVRELIGYGNVQSNKLTNQALKSFAEIFKQEQIKNKVYPLLEFE